MKKFWQKNKQINDSLYHNRREISTYVFTHTCTLMTKVTIYWTLQWEKEGNHIISFWIWARSGYVYRTIKEISKTLGARIILMLKIWAQKFWNSESCLFDSHQHQLESRRLEPHWFDSRWLKPHQLDSRRIRKQWFGQNCAIQQTLSLYRCLMDAAASTLSKRIPTYILSIHTDHTHSIVHSLVPSVTHFKNINLWNKWPSITIVSS